MKLVIGVWTESPTMTEITPTEMSAVYQFAKKIETPIRAISIPDDEMHDPPQGEAGRRVGDSADPVNRHRFGDGQDDDDENRAAHGALEQIEMRLREGNQFPAEKKSDHRAAEKNEGVRHEPELVRRLRFDLGLAARLRQRFAHLCLLREFSDGFGHNSESNQPRLMSAPWTGRTWKRCHPEPRRRRGTSAVVGKATQETLPRPTGR